MLARRTFSSGALVTLELVKYFADHVAPRRSVRLVHKAVTSSTWMETPVNFVKLVNIFGGGFKWTEERPRFTLSLLSDGFFFSFFFLIDTKVFVCLFAGRWSWGLWQVPGSTVILDGFKSSFYLVWLVGLPLPSLSASALLWRSHKSWACKWRKHFIKIFSQRWKISLQTQKVQSLYQRTRYNHDLFFVFLSFWPPVSSPRLTELWNLRRCAPAGDVSHRRGLFFYKWDFLGCPSHACCMYDTGVYNVYRV